MKLKKFDAANYKSVQLRKPSISISITKSYLSKSAAEIMGAKAGDGLAFFQDEENPTDWYVSIDKSGFQLYKTKYSSLSFYATALARNIFKSVKYYKDRFRFNISKEPIKHGNMTVYAVITAEALPNE